LWPKLFSVEPERRPLTKWVLTIAALIVAAVIGLLLLAACASSANSRVKWEATLRITYANGQRITSANAEGIELEGASNAPAKGDGR